MSPGPKKIDFTRLTGFYRNKRQMKAWGIATTFKYKYILYGGALGGGKSFFLRWFCVGYLILMAALGYRELVAMLACEDFPTLKDRQLSKIGKEFPPWLGRSYGDHKEFGRCFILDAEYGGGVICFRNLDDPSKYASSEFALICIDELTKNDYDTFTHLRTRNRWAGLPDKYCLFVGATNPGGKGHGFCKQLWIDKIYGDEWREDPNDPDSRDYTKSFIFIRSLAKDNPFLDAGYRAMLNTLPPMLRKAFRDGSWDIFVGQAFPNFSRDIHVIPRQPVPAGYPVYFTFDWGYARPFAAHWWYVDPDGRVVCCGELYGWSGVADSGVRWEDSRIAEAILEKEEDLRREVGLDARDLIRLAGPDAWNKKPDYRGGGQGPSTADVFSEAGIHMSPGDPSRELKLRQFRERLRVPEEEDTPPMMLIYDDCVHFIRTIPNITTVETDVEMIDPTGELHCYDSACHVCMAWPMGAVEQQEKPRTQAEKDWARVTGQPDEEDGGGVIVYDD